MRALAHPLRIRILEVLRSGPATASLLARELRESSGSTSYHLRELEKAGFVEDVADRGNGRERWWQRTVPLFIVPSDPADDAEYESALAQLRSVIVKRDEEALARYFATIADEPDEWQDAAFLGGWQLEATAEELKAFSRMIFVEVDKLRRSRDTLPPGARTVYITFRALVQPDEGD